MWVRLRLPSIHTHKRKRKNSNEEWRTKKLSRRSNAKDVHEWNEIKLNGKKGIISSSLIFARTLYLYEYIDVYYDITSFSIGPHSPHLPIDNIVTAFGVVGGDARGEHLRIRQSMYDRLPPTKTIRIILLPFAGVQKKMQPTHINYTCMNMTPTPSIARSSRSQKLSKTHINGTNPTFSFYMIPFLFCCAGNLDNNKITHLSDRK